MHLQIIRFPLHWWIHYYLNMHSSNVFCVTFFKCIDAVFAVYLSP